MKVSSRLGGFTIVETMIVLAITSGLFISAVAAMSGRRARIEFSQSVQEIKTEVQKAINDVATGYYPSRNNVICNDTTDGGSLEPTLNGILPVQPQLTSGSSEQGTNGECLFLGKAVQFGVNMNTGNDSIKVYNIVGLRTNTKGPVTNDTFGGYANAAPVAITISGPTGPKEIKTLYGLKATEVYFKPTGSATKTPIGTAAFMSSIAPKLVGSVSETGMNYSLSSASTRVNFIPVTGSTSNDPAGTNTINMINYSTFVGPSNWWSGPGSAGLINSYVNPVGAMYVCYQSGGSNQSALLSIGGDNDLQVTVKIAENRTCAGL